MKLKTLSLVVALVLSSFTVKASYIVGGMISVAGNGSDSTSIGLFVVAETNTQMPSSISLQRWKKDSQGWYQPDGYVTVTGITQSNYHGFYIYNYGSDYFNLDSGDYRFIYKACCWPILENSSNSWDNEIVVSTDYLHSNIWSGNTPYMEQLLPINVQKNAVNSMKPIWGTINSHFVNPDNDSVNLSMTELYQNYSNGVFVPQTPQTSTNVLANNDSITFVGTTLGKHGYGFQIDKYHGNTLVSVQRIQWTFKVVLSTLSIEENEIEKEVLGVWDWQGRYIQKDIKGLTSALYLIRYSDGSYDKVFLMKQ